MGFKNWLTYTSPVKIYIEREYKKTINVSNSIVKYNDMQSTHEICCKFTKYIKKEFDINLENYYCLTQYIYENSVHTIIGLYFNLKNKGVKYPFKDCLNE